MIDVCCAIHDEKGLYCKYLGVMIYSLLDNTRENIRFHILHDDTLSVENRTKLVNIIDKYNGIYRFYSVKIPPHPISDLVIQRYTLGALYRLLIPNILPIDIKKILYLDADIVINLDISHIWNENFDNKVMIGFSNYILSHNEVSGHYFCDIGLIPLDTYINSGVLLINLEKLRKTCNLLEESYRFFEKYPEARYLDQDAINYVLKGKIKVFANDICRSSVISRKYPEKNIKFIYHFFADSPRDTCEHFVDTLFIRYLRKTPWGDDNFIFDHYGRRIADKDDKIKHIYTMMETLRLYPTKKVVYWGATGKLHKPIMKHFSVKSDDYFVDNDPAQWGKQINGGVVYSPQKLRSENKDDVIIINTVFRYTEVKRQLESYGYEEGVHFFNARYLIPEQDTCVLFGERNMMWDI